MRKPLPLKTGREGKEVGGVGGGGTAHTWGLVRSNHFLKLLVGPVLTITISQTLHFFSLGWGRGGLEAWGRKTSILRVLGEGQVNTQHTPREESGRAITGVGNATSRLAHDTSADITPTHDILGHHRFIILNIPVVDGQS